MGLDCFLEGGDGFRPFPATRCLIGPSSESQEGGAFSGDVYAALVKTAADIDLAKDSPPGRLEAAADDISEWL